MEVVEEVDQHAQSAVIAAVEAKHQTRQVGQGWLVVFDVQGGAGAVCAAVEKVAEADLNLGQLGVSGRRD